MPDLDSYLGKVTSEHRLQPNFMATLAALVQPLVDSQATAAEIEGVFDLDTAIGDPLDKIGEWVGQSRLLSVPLTNVYFTLDDVNLGLDFGSLQGPFDPTSGMVSLPDESYRNLLRGCIIINQWDGTIPGAYAAWDALFVSTGYNILIQNTATMHMIMALTGPYPDAITLALFLGGYLSVKPAGVQIDSYQVNNFPYFALDTNSLPFGGLDIGGFGIIVG